ncbi:MAG TPA: hypothetical protein VH207_02535 [Chthoniobacterales bacterium]|nr:hypothetical protein [Chthoniobacterales bacterium]
MKTNLRRQENGSALLWTVLVITVLSLFATEVLRLVSGRFQLGLQAAAWQESLMAAESGIDLAVVEMRKSLYPAPNHAWEDWENIPGNGVVSHGLTTIPNAGLASTPMTIEVNVDAPAQLIDPSTGWQYYRIRTLGSMPLTGPPRIGFKKEDNHLRKLTLRVQRFIDNLFTSETNSPHASRRLEAIVAPLSSFEQAVFSVGALNLNNQNIVIDSYDSRDAAKSTNGLYDESKRQEHGLIATNGALIQAGNAHIYGDVSTNSGTVTGVANVTGVQRTDFYQDPIPVGEPQWLSINPTPSQVNGTATLNASPTKGSIMSRYRLSTLSLSGTQTLTLAGNADGSPTYIEIYVSGDISAAGNSQMVLGPGVRATIYFMGNVDIAGKGVMNPANQPANLLFYGVHSDSSLARHVNLGGNGQISAAVYAPEHDVVVNGGGSSGHVFGSVVGKSVAMTGVTNLHYDEALAAGGIINNYKIVSWVEDTR